MGDDGRFDEFCRRVGVDDENFRVFEKGSHFLGVPVSEFSSPLLVLGSHVLRNRSRLCDIDQFLRRLRVWDVGKMFHGLNRKCHMGPTLRRVYESRLLYIQ